MPRSPMFDAALATGPARIIAEIGCNHQGDAMIAVDMVRRAKAAGADAVKFQMRGAETIDAYDDQPHPDPKHAFGPTYREHRRALELDDDALRLLKDAARDAGIPIFPSVWDAEAFGRALDHGFSAVKLPSARPSLELARLAQTAGLDLFVSTGGMDLGEVLALVKPLQRPAVVMQCTASYPCAPDDTNLGVLTTYGEWFRSGHALRHFSGTDVPQLAARHIVGFSCHVPDPSIVAPAVALGARVVELHFTLDRCWRGTDHAASFDPRAFAEAVRHVRTFEAALGDGTKRVLDCERPAIEKLRHARIA